MKNKDEPAYPVKVQRDEPGMIIEYEGLTKREYFAALAMQGKLSADSGAAVFMKSFAKDCVELADILLAELEKEQGK